MKTWAALILLSLASAQPAGPQFEVATIKPATPDRYPTEMLDSSLDELRFGEGAGSRANSGSFEARGVTLRMLVAHAYGVPLSRVMGPDWVDSQRWDIAAKIPGQPGLDGFRKMQQQLLAERFKLVLRSEAQKKAVYRMTVAKGGHKLKAATVMPNYASEAEMRAALLEIAAKAPPMVPGTSQRLGHANASADDIAARFSTKTDLPLKNLTGLKGQYSFTVDWSNRDPNGFRDAVQDQLGLVLERSSEDLDVVVIEQALRTPTEN